MFLHGTERRTLVTLLPVGTRGEPGTVLWERLQRVFDYSEPFLGSHSHNYQLQQRVLAVAYHLSVTDSSHCPLFSDFRVVAC